MKKNPLLVAGVASMLIALSACGSASTTGGSENDGDGANASDAIEIELYNRKLEAKEIVEKIAEEYNVRTPGVVIKVNSPTTSAQGGNDPFAVRIASGDVPEIFTDWPAMPEFVERAREGIMLDLSGEAFIEENVNPAILDLFKVDGKDYAAEISLNTVGVAYNKTMFEEHGWEIPTTLDELFDLSDTIEAEGITPFTFGDREAWTIGHTVQGLYAEYIPEHLDFWRGIADGTTKAEDSAELRLVAETELKLRDYGQADTLGADFDQQVDDFASGKSAMIMQGNWAIPGIQKANPDLDFAFFPFPAAKAAGTELIIGVDFALAIAADAEHPDEAIAFLEYFTSPEVAQQYMDFDGAPPSINGVVSQTVQMELMNQYIADEKTDSWSVGAWAPGMEVEMANVIQNLVATKDVDAFLSDIDTLLEPTDAPPAR